MIVETLNTIFTLIIFLFGVGVGVVLSIIALYIGDRL